MLEAELLLLRFYSGYCFFISIPSNARNLLSPVLAVAFPAITLKRNVLHTYNLELTTYNP